MQVPNILKKLLEPYPTETQLVFREAIERLHLQNPDDPIFELMLLLGLWATYYKEISGQIVDNGQAIKKQNAEALKSLDERVRLLQGLAQTIQQATDQITSAGAEIVKKLPVDAIAHQIIERINKSIESLPVEKLEKTLSTVNAEMNKVAQNSESAIKELDKVSQKIKGMAHDIEHHGLPGFSILLIGMGIIIGVLFMGILKALQWI